MGIAIGARGDELADICNAILCDFPFRKHAYSHGVPFSFPASLFQQYILYANLDPIRIQRRNGERQNKCWVNSRVLINKSRSIINLIMDHQKQILLSRVCGDLFVCVFFRHLVLLDLLVEFAKMGAEIAFAEVI